MGDRHIAPPSGGLADLREAAAGATADKPMTSPHVGDGATGQRDQEPEVRVSIRGLTKTFRRTGGELVKAVDDISLDVMSQEILVLLGPSGCGKSTLLRCIAGLENPDEGSLAIGGVTVFDVAKSIVVPPNQRDANMMFQSYALWPHMTLEDNVAYPLRVQGTRKHVARRRANEYLQLVGLDGLGKQYVANVSGGQAQRVALARTLVGEPAVVLFDEPLSNVDAKVRSRLRAELLRLHSMLGFSAVYVTHDQVEAMGVGTRLAVMSHGRIHQLGGPVSIYEEPASRYAAEFIGEANILEGQLEAVDAYSCVVRTTLGPVTVPVGELDRSGERRRRVGDDTVLMVRPEYCRLRDENAADDAPRENLWTGVVATALYAGSRTEYTLHVNGAVMTAWEMGAQRTLAAETPVQLHIPPSALRMLAE